MSAVIDPDLVAWLNEGDPAVRWRVLELTGATEHQIQRERARVATQGWGARLLAEQDDDGGWGGGIYSPKWISTTYTMLHLMWLGLPASHPAALRGCERLWEWQARWRPVDFENCIESMLVRLTTYFAYPAPELDGVVTALLDEQHEDGGWNCAAPTEATGHSSFHTSIQALEALASYRSAGGSVEVADAEQRGREFFLRHQLFKSHRTGEVAIPSSTRFPAFPEWHFDVLRGLEHFASVSAPIDDRLADAVGLLEGKRRKDGRWSTYAPYSGRHWFRLEPSGPSRWTTVRALRVLSWWYA